MRNQISMDYHNSFYWKSSWKVQRKGK